MEPELIAHIIIGSSLWPFVVYFKLFPPKKINNFYGYRTKSSMKDQESWDTANRYSANALLVVALITNLFQFVSWYLFNPETSFLASTGFMVMALLLTIPFTERYLKNS
jgi:uncharacterized membrane protein